MTSPLSWLSPSAIQALGWALIHFVWQGVGVAALAALAMEMFRRPGTRYGIGIGALALMIAMPVADFLLLENSAAPALSLSGFVFAVRPGLMPWLVEAWAAGVGIFSLRFAGGYLLLEQKRRQQSGAPEARVLALCRDVQRLLGIERAIEYLECGWVQVPSAIGWLRPVILLPAAALIGLSETQLRAVIAHELAHVRRWDFLVNLIQIFAETVFFYHPALWWLNRRIRAERELCCDEIAVSVTGDRMDYAHALVQMAKLGSAPDFAMAATHGILSERIFHILGRGHEKPRIAGLAGSVVLLAASAVMAAGLMAPHVSNTIIRPVVPLISSQIAAAPFAEVPRDNGYVIPVRARLALFKTLARPKIDAISLPLVMVADEAAEPVVPVVQADAPPHPESIVAQKLDAMMLPADDTYPAPTLKLEANHLLHDGWTWATAISYCKDFAAQTVTQGANRQMAVDAGVKQRLAFFYWHCMNSNGETGSNDYISPAYTAVGQASLTNPVNASGSWTVSMRAQPARVCSFAQSANTLSGDCAGPEGHGAATGVIDGRQIRWSWKFTLDDGRQGGELDFIGTLGRDGTMSGQTIAVEDIIVRQAQGSWEQIGTFTATPGGPPTQVAFQ